MNLSIIAKLLTLKFNGRQLKLDSFIHLLNIIIFLKPLLENQYLHSYNFCFVDDYLNWGYCSPDPYRTSHFGTCLENHDCGKHGYDYYWCYTDYYNNWDYCSPPSTTRSGTRYYDAHGFVCNGPCDNHDGTTYTWCTTDNGWGYCSKQLNLATDGNPCLESSPCTQFQDAGYYHYRWCDTETGWHYCGDINDCVLPKYVARHTRQAGRGNQRSCSNIDSHNSNIVIELRDPSVG
jgi:hypothetical protein